MKNVILLVTRVLATSCAAGVFVFAVAGEELTAVGARNVFFGFVEFVVHVHGSCGTW